MPRTLDDIAADYERVELTALWVHDTSTKRHLNIFSVVELCPSEQERSPGFSALDKAGGIVPMERRNLGGTRTAYLTRIFLNDPKGGVAFYRGDPLTGARTLPMQKAILLESAGTLTEEPPSEIPILLSRTNAQSLLGAVLPARRGSLRLCSRFDVDGSLAGLLSDEELAVASDFSKEMLGVDLSRHPYATASVHLCMANPLLRHIDERLAADDGSILVEMLQRDGRTAVGSTIEFTDVRQIGEAFNIRVEVTGSHLIVPIPYRPESVRTRFFSQFGECLEDTQAVFLQSVFVQMQLVGQRRRIRINSPDGAVEREVSTISIDDASRRRPETALSPQQLLLDAQRRQALEQLEKDRTFVYFDGQDGSRDRALLVVRAILGEARDRVVLCDPYLSGSAIAEVIPDVVVQKLPIRLLGSTRFLRQRLRPRSHSLRQIMLDFARRAPRLRKILDAHFPVDESTERDRLLGVLTELARQDPSLNVSYRAMGGKHSSFHDRFLVIDDDVFLLGSSLGSFGSRPTTIFKAPDPERLISSIETWWSESLSIDEAFPCEQVLSGANQGSADGQ